MVSKPIPLCLGTLPFQSPLSCMVETPKRHMHTLKREEEELKSKKKLSKQSRRNAGGSDDSNQKGFLAGDCPESTRASANELDLCTASLLEAVTLSQSCWGLW